MTQSKINLPPYISPDKIKETLGILGRTKALALEASDPTFPKRIKLFGGRKTAFRTQELIDWIESQADK